MTVQRDNLEVATGAEVVEEAESVLEGTPTTTQPQPAPTPAPPTPTPVPSPKPPVTPQCCGQTPKFFASAEDLTSDGSVEHDANCPNHPDNLAKEVLA